MFAIIRARCQVRTSTEAAKVMKKRLELRGSLPQRYHVESIGSADSMSGVLMRRIDLMETLLAHHRHR